MATVKGPLMSMDASGQIGGAIVFSKWKGRNYVRRHAIPANPQSAAQVSFRSMMTMLTQYWSTISTVNQATWEALADAQKISPFNAYIQYSMKRWDHFKGPSEAYPAGEVGEGGDAPTTTPTAGVKEISLSIAHGVASPDWGWIIHRSTTTGFTPSRSTAVAAIPTSADPDVYVDAPLLTGTAYYYRIGGISLDGVKGTLEAERTATPT